MRIAILMANTDESEFSKHHPKDGEKFRTLLQRVRPDWMFDVYSVKDGIFPSEINGWDGVIVTGSPASVRDKADWIAQLKTVIRELHSTGIPLFGACFGHQVIATALGGEVGPNPDGWVIGAVTTRCLKPPQSVAFYAAHTEQVIDLPSGAEVVAETPGCAIAGFMVGRHILTTQYHPEMTRTFVAALLDELRGDLGDAIANRAEASLATEVKTDELAQWIACFFESASARVDEN